MRWLIERNEFSAAVSLPFSNDTMQENHRQCGRTIKAEEKLSISG